MDKWEIPSCCICYERLLTKLTLLPDCGHIYHQECLQSWTDKIGLTNLKCPLCRTNVVNNIYPLNYTITKIEESNPKHCNGVDNDKSKTDVVYSAQIKSYQDEIDDLKSRLSTSKEDRIECYNKIQDLEEQYKVLKDKLNKELNTNDQIVKQNKELVLSSEKQKATNSALTKKLNSLKNELEKLKNISKYLEDPNDSQIQDIAAMVEKMTSDEKIKFLMNRIVDLNGIVNELKDANETVTNERDKMDKLYKKMKIAIRECAKLQKKKHANEENEKLELPDYNSEDFVEFLYNKRMMLEKALNKPTNEQESVKLTTNISKGAGIKNTTLTPEKSKAVNSNVSDTNNGNDPNNQGLSNIIRKMKTIKSSTPPPRYKQQSSVKQVRTPEKQAVRGLSNSNTPDLLSAKSENQQTTPVRYNKARTFKKYKSNGNGPRNEKTTKIHSFFKQTKEDVW